MAKIEDVVNPDTGLFDDADGGRVMPPILRYFAWDHLLGPLRTVSQSFCDLAMWVVEHVPDSPERTVALRKLLEAKDAAVRAALG